MKDIGDTIEIILVLVVVFYLTWVVTRFIAARSKGKTSGRFMHVVDRLAISNDKAILLVKIGSEYCVIGMTGHEMRLIKTLDDAEAETFAAGETGKTEAWGTQGGTSGSIMKGMQSFGQRLGFAMKRPSKPQSTYKGYTPDEYEQSAGRSHSETPTRPQATNPYEQSAIDRMNERIKLRKESKWR